MPTNMANEQLDRGQEADQGSTVGWPGSSLNRQLQLWEPHPGKADEQTRHDDPIPVEAKSATPSPSVQEEERQLQWIYRWLEESTQ